MKLVQLTAIATAAPLASLTSAQLRELQTALTQLGYGVNGIDGLIGPSTRAAWAAFKADIASGNPDSIGPASVLTLQQRLDAPPTPATDDVPAAAVKIVKFYEGLRTTAYDDGTGVWTIGYGTTRYPDGRSVQRGDTCTSADAERYLASDIGAYATQLGRSIPNWLQMNADQRSALICFAYNLGPGFYGASGFETISATLRDRRWDDVPQALALYSMPGSDVHAGLLARRQAEGLLWDGDGPYASMTA